MTFSPCFFVPDDSFPAHSGVVAHHSLSYSRCGEEKSTAAPTFLAFISAVESVPAEIAAPVPVGSAPELSHKRNEPQRSFQACGTTLRELNAPGSNSPIRRVPTPRRYVSDQPLDHRTWQWLRRDSDVQL